MTALPAAVSAVTTTRPIDGRRQRRAPGASGSRSGRVVAAVVRHDVMAAAKAARRPGERLVIVDAECVRLVPDHRVEL